MLPHLPVCLRENEVGDFLLGGKQGRGDDVTHLCERNPIRFHLQAMRQKKNTWWEAGKQKLDQSYKKCLLVTLFIYIQLQLRSLATTSTNEIQNVTHLL